MSFDSIYVDKNGVDVVDKVRNGGGVYSEEEVMKFRNDEDCMFAAVRKNGMALRYGSEEIQNNIDIAMIAVQDGGTNIQYAGDNIRNSEELVKVACENDVFALGYLDDSWRNNKEFITDLAVNSNIEVLTQADPRVLEDKTFIENVVEQRPDGLGAKFATNEMLDDPEFAKKVVAKNGEELMWFGDEIKDNPEVVKEAVKQNPEVLYMASDRLNDRVERSSESNIEKVLDNVARTDKLSAEYRAKSHETENSREVEDDLKRKIGR